MRVRLVVPTSRSMAPDRAMMSGMRNPSPISISSPRETTTSASGGQLVQGQKNGGGVVVDGDGRSAQQPFEKTGRYATSRFRGVPDPRSYSRLE